MAICKKCGVDLGEGNEICPLCEPSDNLTARPISVADLFRLSRIRKTRHLYEISMLLLISGAIITLAIDAVFTRGFGWSLLTTLSIAYLIILASSIYFLRRKPYLAITIVMISTLLFLWLLDLLTGGPDWYRPLACPLTVAAALLTTAVLFLNSLSRYRGLNLLATILTALAVFMLITEYLTDRIMTAAYNPQWSVVTAASLFIIALFFIFIHYRLKRGRSLGRLFHV